MRHAAPVIVFAMLLFAALAAWLWSAGTGAPVPLEGLVVVPPTGDLSDQGTDTLRERARAGSCAVAEPLWWEVTEREPDDLEAWKALARCGRSDEIDAVVADAAELFEESRVLAVVPAVLDALDVRDLVPILNEVQADASDPADLRRIGELRLALGDVTGAVDALQKALQLDPEDAESHVQLGYALVDAGRVSEAREAFRRGVASEPPGLRMTRLYAMSVAWPAPFSGVVLGLVGLAATLGVRRGGVSAIIGDERARDRTTDAITVAAGLLATSALLAWFALTADRMAFGLLLVLCAFSAFWLAASPLRSLLGRGLSGLGSNAAALLAGRLQDRVARLPLWGQVAMAVTSLALLLVFVPLLGDVTARVALGALVAVVLVSTMGALLLRLLGLSRTLKTALRWLGVAGTLPFLLFFLYFERRSMVDALFSGTFIDRDAQNRLVAYLIVWGIGLALAWLLARILATSILDPLGRILQTVERVRSGDFDVRVGVERHDEIGQLGAAVEEMAAGLRQREEMRQTFRRYLDPEVAERLMAGDAKVLQGRLVHATVLFSDVRGFTSLSERLEPAQVVGILNEYLARMEPVVRRWGGVVDKFLGDGMLAVWDVPEPRSEGPLAGIPGERLAVQAAVEMLEALRAFDEELQMRGLPSLSIGIGVNSGELIAGPVGSRDRMEYTVIGDTVNTAQRVEGQARGDAPLLVTESVAKVLAPYAELEPREPVALKGKAEPVPLFRVIRILVPPGR